MNDDHECLLIFVEIVLDRKFLSWHDLIEFYVYLCCRHSSSCHNPGNVSGGLRQAGVDNGCSARGGTTLLGTGAFNHSSK